MKLHFHVDFPETRYTWRVTMWIGWRGFGIVSWQDRMMRMACIGGSAVHPMRWRPFTITETW
jgi:hypothetical protein